MQMKSETAFEPDSVFNLNSLVIGNLILANDAVSRWPEFTRVDADRKSHRLVRVVTKILVSVSRLPLMRTCLETNHILTVSRNTTAFVETKLMRLINAGNLGAIALYLKCKAGWREGTDVKFEDTTPGVPASRWLDRLHASMSPDQWKTFAPMFRQAINDEMKEKNDA